MGVIFAYIILAIFSGIFITLKVVEPTYVYFFKRPLFLHWKPLFFFTKSNLHLVKILDKEFVFYKNLNKKQKKYFERRVINFLQTYSFIGKEIVVTPQMKLLIAGTYVMLTFGMRNYLTLVFNKIIIYPTAYYSNLNGVYHKGEFNPQMKIIVFSWEDFINGHQLKNNINLGLHEFSHAIHFHCMKNNDPSAVIFHDGFVEVLSYFTQEKQHNELKQKDYFRWYAYKNKFEFIAVVLEHFFETPHIFKEKHPELYEKVLIMINFLEVDMKSKTLA